MNRAFRSAASVFCWLLVLPSLADTSRAVESVTVESQNALPGIWRFPPHERQSVWSKKGTDIVAEFASMGPEKYCRIGRADSGYSFNCLEIAERSPRARLGAFGRVYLSWSVLFGVPGCDWRFQGRLESGTAMSGHLGMQCGMVLREKPQPITITKMVLSENIPDAGGQAAFLRHLLDEMAKGQVTEPSVKPHFVSSNPNVIPLPDEVQQRLMVFLTPETLRELGRMTAVVYIGDYFPIVGWGFAPQPDPSDKAPTAAGPVHKGPVYGDKRPIYAVEFENGERLCALHRRPDGVLDQFQCV